MEGADWIRVAQDAGKWWDEISLFRVLRQRRFVVSPDVSEQVKQGLINCAETSLNNYEQTLHNIQKSDKLAYPAVEA
jgi:hypothetical protein